MLDKNLINLAEVPVQPNRYLESGSVLVTDQINHQKVDQKLQKLEPKMEGTVKRLIAHFLDSK
jgi:hypothetical protein